MSCGRLLGCRRTSAVGGIRLRRGPDRGGREVPLTSRACRPCLGSLGTGQRPVGLGGPGTSASLDHLAMVPRALEDPRRAVARQGFGAPLGSKHRAPEFSVGLVSSQIGVAAGEVVPSRLVLPGTSYVPVPSPSRSAMPVRVARTARVALGQFSGAVLASRVAATGGWIRHCCGKGPYTSPSELWTKNTSPAPTERGASAGVGRKALVAPSRQQRAPFGSCVQSLVWRSPPKLRSAELAPERVERAKGVVFREGAASA
jgi:hypothetical protein